MPTFYKTENADKKILYSPITPDQPAQPATETGGDKPEVESKTFDSTLDLYQRRFLHAFDPAQSDSDLFNELQKNGPLMVLGYYGQANYSKPATNTQREVGGHAVLAWPADSHQPQQPACMLCVGMVYDGKTPRVLLMSQTSFHTMLSAATTAEADKQPIYLVSFDRLKQAFLARTALDTISVTDSPRTGAEVAEVDANISSVSLIAEFLKLDGDSIRQADEAQNAAAEQSGAWSRCQIM